MGLSGLSSSTIITMITKPGNTEVVSSNLAHAGVFYFNFNLLGSLVFLGLLFSL